MADPSQCDESHKEPENAGSSKMDSIRMLLKRTAHYAMLGFAPVVAIIALVIAITAISASRSSQAQLTAALAKLDAANTALKASKTELDNIKAGLSNLKTEITQQKTKQEEASKNQETLNGKVVQAVSRLQTKMKVTPILEEQLQLNASALSAPLPAVIAPAATVAVPAASKKSLPQTQAIKEAIEKFNKK